jgi:hypothetical protein
LAPDLLLWRTPRPRVHADHTTHDHHHRVTEVLDAEFIHGDDFKTPLTPAQEEHFNLIFSLNDTTNVGHIKVTELAQFMESLGHGLPIGSRAALSSVRVDAPSASLDRRTAEALPAHPRAQPEHLVSWPWPQ